MDSSKRLLSLDIFRGMTIAFMILVNNPGDWSNVYSPLLHADWHGCTPTDLVFPFFLFIVGVSISLALGKRKQRGDAKGAIIQKILRRTLIIFGIGLFLNAFPFFEMGSLRIPGVLQRIALVYGACALIFLYTDWKQQVQLGFGLLILYWGMMTLLPVPGIGPANLEPETNLGAWLDNLIMPGHLWSQSKVWDPEGLLSTLPAISSGLAGVLTGTWLKSKRTHNSKLVGLFGIGALLIFAGLTWDLAFPINKKIWTSSYVLYTSGIAIQSLAFIYWLVDVLGYKKWIKPFLIYGTNALIVYAASSLFAETLYTVQWTNASGEVTTLKGWLYHGFFTSVLSDLNASLAFAIFNVLVLFAFAWVLYSRKIFIKV